MDAFFASVELRRRPELRGRPVVVGGDGRRGVVAAASYEARVYGIRSAMSSAQARRLCPDAVFLPGDHAHYAEVSARLMDVFHSFTPLVEPISLDEAFLDVSGALRVHGDPETIAHTIRRRILDEERLTCSVGVAPNKYLAKLASESAKPRPGRDGPVFGTGVRVVEPDAVRGFLDPLPIRAVWGIGPATGERLDRLGIRTVADLASMSVEALVAAVGKAHGRHLWELARGIDDRRVVPVHDPKSVSHEETFDVDIFDVDRLTSQVVRMADAVGDRLRRGDQRARTVVLKVRFGDFRTITRSATLDAPTDSGAAIARAAKALLARIDPAPGVRLLGVGVSGFAVSGEGEQLSLDDLLTAGGLAAGGASAPGPVASAPTADWRRAESAIDHIRDRFGAAAIAPASALGPSGLRPKRRGDQQWGPSSTATPPGGPERR